MILEVAEAWGIPPWEVINAPGSALWITRFATRRKYQRLAQSNADPGYEDDGLERFA